MLDIGGINDLAFWSTGIPVDFWLFWNKAQTFKNRLSLFILFRMEAFDIFDRVFLF